MQLSAPSLSWYPLAWCVLACRHTLKCFVAPFMLLFYLVRGTQVLLSQRGCSLLHSDMREPGIFPCRELAAPKGLETPGGVSCWGVKVESPAASGKATAVVQLCPAARGSPVSQAGRVRAADLSEAPWCPAEPPAQGPLLCLPAQGCAAPSPLPGQGSPGAEPSLVLHHARDPRVTQAPALFCCRACSWRQVWLR